MNGQILAIANQKGGVGKTTTAVSLGAALSTLGRKVLVVDLDPHANASVHLSVFPEKVGRSSWDLFQNEEGEGTEELRGAIIHDERTGMDLLPGHMKLSELEMDFRERPGRGLLLQKALPPVAKGYDHVLLDCPPHMGLIMVNALVASDMLLIPIQTDFLALHGVKLLFDTMRVLSKLMGNQLPFKALPTMVDIRTSATRRVLSILQRNLQGRLFSTAIGLDTKFREASARGSSIFQVDPNARGARQYLQLAREILN